MTAREEFDHDVVLGSEALSAGDESSPRIARSLAGRATTRPRALMIGPMPRAGTPIGGTQVSFDQLVSRLRAGGRFDVDVVDTSRVVHGESLVSRVARDTRLLATVLSAVLRKARTSDVVVLNMSSGALVKAGPMVGELARVLDTPLVVRAFGGCLDESYDRLPSWGRRWVDETLFASPLVLLQTHALCRRFGHVEGVRWFPTTRDCPSTIAPVAPRCRKFLFLSQVRVEKGVLDALEAARRLPAGCTLTVRGPLMPGFDPSVFDGHPNATYGGPVDARDVGRVFAEHDALVFPSWYEGEGIPGVVIESLQAGRAVIATSWRTLPEIVEDEMSGLIVPTRDVDALAHAMSRLAVGPALHQRLARGARVRGVEFDAAGWHRRFENWLEQVIEDEVPTRLSTPIAPNVDRTREDDPESTPHSDPLDHVPSPVSTPIEEHVA